MICPLLAMAASDGMSSCDCQREKCSWWVKQKNDQYSQCAVRNLSHCATSIMLNTRPPRNQGGGDGGF